MSTWETNELPVLRALALHFAQPGAGPPSVAEISAETGFDQPRVLETLRVLTEAKPPYVVGVSVRQGGEQPRVTALTERAVTEMRHVDLKEGWEKSGGQGGLRSPAGPRPPGAPKAR